MNCISKHEFENANGQGVLSWMPIEREKEKYDSAPKQHIEKEALRILMEETMGAGFQIERDSNGKPWPTSKNGFISVSHSANWVAFCFHPNQPVGIDIEGTRVQLSKVANRILHPSENELLKISSNKQRTLQLLWGGKEALYKAYGKKNLEFSSQLILSKIDDNSIDFSGDIILPNAHWQFDLSLIKPDEASYLIFTNNLTSISTK